MISEKHYQKGVVVWLMRNLNAAISALFYLFFVLPAFLHSTNIRTLEVLWFALVSIPAVLLIANFIFRKTNIPLSIFWGVSWAAVWTGALFLYVATYMGIPWIQDSTYMFIWVAYVMTGAAIVNFLSAVVLPFWNSQRMYVPNVRIRIENFKK